MQLVNLHLIRFCQIFSRTVTPRIRIPYFRTTKQFLQLNENQDESASEIINAKSWKQCTSGIFRYLNWPKKQIMF